MQLTLFAHMGRYPYWLLSKLPYLRKFLAILLFVTSLFATASVQAQGSITLNEKNASLEKVLLEIKKQSGYNVVYTRQLLANTRKIDIQLKNATLQAALDQCLKDQPLDYAIIERTVILKPKVSAKTDADNKNVLLPSEPPFITGIVWDPSGEPLNGATVRVKGTENVTSTLSSGVFRLPGNPGDVLVVSFIGYETREVKVNVPNMGIVLQFAQTELDKIQIIAYGTTTKRYSVGNISTVKAEDIKNQPVSNVLSALQGMVPGLEVSNTSGDPGAAVNARIRGINSVSSVRGVLVLIDGAPGDLNTIPPADIASIDVLKDASATAIYGARGSDGVIIITTKRGAAESEGKIRFSAYTNIAQPTKIAKVLNTSDYRMLRKEAFRNDNITPTVANAPDLFLDSTINTYWAKELYKKSITQDYQLSFSGGNKATTYYLSSGYRKEDAILEGNWYQKRVNMRVGFDTKMTKNFKVGGGIGYINTNTRTHSSGIAAMINYALPMVPYKDTLGNINLKNYFPNYNPNGQLTSYNLANNDQLLGNAYLSYDILSHFNFRADFNYQVLNGKTTIFNPTTANIFPSTGNSGSFGNSGSRTWNFEPQLSYDRNFGRHYFKLLIGGTLLSTNSNATNINTLTPANAIDDLNTVTSGTVSFRTYTETPYRFNSLFSRLNYSFNNRYLLEGVIRRDGSSRFGPDNQFGNFYSIGAGWLFSAEPFIQQWLGKSFFGKLRANYGTTGNDNISNFGYLTNSTVASNGYNANNTIYVANIANPDIHWELTKKLDVGLDLSFLQNRLTISADYYRNRTTNTLFARSLSYVAGYNGFTSNLGGVVDNTGTDISVNFVALTGNEFKWTTQFNFSSQKSKLVSLPGLSTSSIISRYTYKEGEPLALNWGFKYLGVDQATGLAQFQDVDKNGIISSYTPDYQVIGKTIPDYYGGWNNQISYKNFDMQVFTQFVGGITKSYNIYSAIGDMFNLPPGALRRWQKQGDITDVPRAAVAGTAAYNINSNISQSDFAYSNASYIRVKNITLGYTFSGDLLKKGHINSLRIYMTGYNLFTITKYKGDDPENGASFVPMQRIYTFGLSMEL